MATVVISFVLASVATRRYEDSAVSRADLIVGNAMPSVKQLVAARSQLLAIDNALDDYATASDADRPTIASRIQSNRQNLEEAIAIYLSLPFFPNERELYAHVEEDYRQLDAPLAAFLASRDGHELSSLHARLDRIDRSLARVVSFDAAQGERLGLEIERTHAEASVLIVVLDGISVLLAVAAGVLALRQLRRAARAQAAERAARDRRESELAVQNEALGQFSGRVAHDVIGPLATAQLAFDLLREAPDDPPASQRAIERGVSAVRRAHTLLEGLLAFSKAGGRPEPGVSTLVAPVLADLVDELALQAKQQDISLTVDHGVDGAVACSAGVLTSILSNLVRNAIKYMGDARRRDIAIRVRALGDRWRFEVQDSGPGIPKEDHDRIFQPYVRLSHAGSGIGLGLATVDRLVRAHDGTLGVVAPVEGGTLFWFELPVYRSVRSATARTSTSISLEPSKLTTK